jgi:4-diphosphocytidyl-2-C-methyl-D-erythritol kinase
MQILAPAKINLSLKILGRQSNGFHEIETLIAPISLSDELNIEKQGKRIDFRCDDPSVPAGDDNLVVRAANAFLQQTKLKGGVSIELKKKIPHGAGLGGGSSDAAATLLALDWIFETHLSQRDLAEIGSTIGSDVPFFIFRSAAFCKGRGETVVPVKLPRPLSILLLKPHFGVATKWAYSRWQDSKELSGINYSPQQFLDRTFVNDLERPVFEKFLFLAELKMWLLKQPEVGAALMSGSGSTVFAVMRENANADAVGKRACNELDRKIWWCACTTL